MPRRPPAHRPHGASKATKHSSQQPRQSPSRRGYGRDWQALRLRKIKTDPLCEDCLERGRTTLTEEVHHIRSIREAPELRLVWSNLRSLCKDCHDKHTLSETSPAPRPAGPQGEGGSFPTVRQPGTDRG